MCSFEIGFGSFTAVLLWVVHRSEKVSEQAGAKNKSEGLFELHSYLHFAFVRKRDTVDRPAFSLATGSCRKTRHSFFSLALQDMEDKSGLFYSPKHQIRSPSNGRKLIFNLFCLRRMFILPEYFRCLAYFHILYCNETEMTVFIVISFDFDSCPTEVSSLLIIWTKNAVTVPEKVRSESMPRARNSNRAELHWKRFAKWSLSDILILKINELSISGSGSFFLPSLFWTCRMCPTVLDGVHYQCVCSRRFRWLQISTDSVAHLISLECFCWSPNNEGNYDFSDS